VCVVVLFLGLGVVFPIVGSKVRKRLSNVPIIKSSRQAKTQEIMTVTWILTSVFLVRSILILALPNALHVVWTQPMLDDYFWVYNVLVVLYYCIFEACPCAVVLWIQRRLPPQRSSGVDAIGELNDSLLAN